MTKDRRFFFRSVASTFDQALLSLLNFIIGITLIRLASKESYGLYTLLFAAGTLSSALLEALIGSALATIAPRLPERQRTAMIARVARLHWSASIVVALVFGLGAGFGSSGSGVAENPVLVGMAFAFFVATLSAREFCRTALFIESQAVAVARLDSLYFALTLGLAVAYFGVSPEVNVVGAMLVLGLANGIAAGIFSTRLWQDARGTTLALHIADLRELWHLSRWAFAGSFNGWLGNNAYLYFAGAYIGVEASADLNAARLLLVPVALLSVAWGRVARPTAGKLLAQHDLAGLEKFTWKSIGALCAAILAFSIVLVLALPWLQTHLLGAKYAQATQLVPLWGLYFIVNAARAVGTTVLMSYGWFKVLFWQGSLSLVILALGCMLLMPAFGIFGALSAMIIVETIEFITNMVLLLPRAKRRQQPSALQS